MNAPSARSDPVNGNLFNHPARKRLLQGLLPDKIGMRVAELLHDDGAIAHVEADVAGRELVCPGCFGGG